MARKPKIPTKKSLEKIIGRTVSDTAYRQYIGELPVDSKLGTTAKLEAVLNSLEYPEKTRISKVCKNETCKGVFMTTYKFVAYCSDYCRRESLKSVFGIQAVENHYVSKPDEDRWGGTEYPQIIDQQALAVMKYLVEKAESETGQTIQPWSGSQPLVESEEQPVPLQSAPSRVPIPQFDFDEVDALLEDIF